MQDPSTCSRDRRQKKGLLWYSAVQDDFSHYFVLYIVANSAGSVTKERSRLGKGQHSYYLWMIQLSF